MFESRDQPLAPRTVFLLRIFYSGLMTLGVIALSLGLGTWGYHAFGEMAWIDALLNASMILAGMGPVNPIESTAGKLFATFYCLFSGIVFLTMMAIMLAPAYHRFMHRFHLDDECAVPPTANRAGRAAAGGLPPAWGRFRIFSAFLFEKSARRPSNMATNALVAETTSRGRRLVEGCISRPTGA